MESDIAARILARRRLILGALALPTLAACAAPLPRLRAAGVSPDALALLDDAAAAHGAASFAAVQDLNIAYSGHWHGLVARLQPVLVDAGFRGSSEERFLPAAGLVAQAHTGPAGCKHVIRHLPNRVPAGGGTRADAPPGGDIRVYFNGIEATDRDRRAAAALVVDGYAMFLLGPLLLDRGWLARRSVTAQLAGVARIDLGQGGEFCDVLELNLAPGLGFADSDRIALYVDRRERLMRRVRFTLNGLESTRGAIAEVDCSDHRTDCGVRWPTRFAERLLRPVPLAVHDWRLTGLDINRGYAAADLANLVFAGKAFPPATSLP